MKEIDEKKRNEIRDITEIVFNYFDLPIVYLHSKSRNRELVQARQIAMYFSRKLTKASYELIGEVVGSKDHVTAMHGEKTVKNLYETSREIKNHVDTIEELIYDSIDLRSKIQYKLRPKNQVIELYIMISNEICRLQVHLPNKYRQMQIGITESLNRLQIELKLVKWVLGLIEIE
jgi:hypothetical protein